MSRVDVERPFPEWVREQQLALAAWRLQNQHVGMDDESLEIFSNFFEDAVVKLTRLDYERLPVLTLAMMQGIQSEHLLKLPRSDAFATFKANALHGYNTVTNYRKTSRRPAIVRSARILCDALLGSSAHTASDAFSANVTLPAFGIEDVKMHVRSLANDDLVAARVAHGATIKEPYHIVPGSLLRRRKACRISLRQTSGASISTASAPAPLLRMSHLIPSLSILRQPERRCSSSCPAPRRNVYRLPEQARFPVGHGLDDERAIEEDIAHLATSLRD